MRREFPIGLVLAGLVTAVEYSFRHYVLFWMPVIGTRRVDDMLALALAYALLTVGVGAAAHLRWRAELTALGQALRELLTQWTFLRWIIAMFLSLVVLSIIDRALWGGVRLPMWVSAYRNETVWFAGAAQILTAVSTIAVNGLLVPVAEEYLWRGNIQPRFQQALPAAAAVALTATLFSLKHVLVDASLVRFLTLTAFGAICGIVALRHSWRHSASLHLVVNTIATTAGLAMTK